MELRDYQISAVDEIYAAWRAGYINVCVQLATGGGKTALFSYIMSKHLEPSIAIAHRVELVSQISITLARYGVYHNIIAQKNSIREIVAAHVMEFGRSYLHQQARVTVAGVDTLLRLPPNYPLFKRVTLVVQDEGHHPLKKNKWGKAAELFPNAVGLYPTATPTRADGRGLSRQSDGIMDILIEGITMRELIKRKYLTEYRIIAPPTTVKLADVPLAASGDYSPVKLRKAVHSSQITGNVVDHYLKFARGKLGVTFAVDIEAATQIAQAYQRAGVTAEVISSKTPDLLRAKIMRDFRERKILQIVNVDLLGEGVDVPAIEVVSMARPTQSYGLYCQQFGRALRPMKGKKHAIIIDHVDNIIRHGLPDSPRVWTLDRRERKSRSTTAEIPLRNCIECLSVYPATTRTCPHCGHYSQPVSRGTPEAVDGDLCELDPQVLARMRGEVERIDNPPRIPQHLEPIAQMGLANRHRERQERQRELRAVIATWCGYLKEDSLQDSEIQSTFWFRFNIDILSAQTLGGGQLTELMARIQRDIDEMGNKRGNVK